MSQHGASPCMALGRVDTGSSPLFRACPHHRRARQGPLVVASAPPIPAQLQPLQRAAAVSTCATAGADQNENGDALLCCFSLRGCLLSPECHCVSAEWLVPLVQSAKTLVLSLVTVTGQKCLQKAVCYGPSDFPCGIGSGESQVSCLLLILY